MRATDLFDGYLLNTLSVDDRLEFEQRLKSEEGFSEAFEKHKQLLRALNLHEERIQLRKALQSIHESEIGKEAKILPLQKETPIRKLGKTVAVAAGVVVIAVLTTLVLLSTGGYLLKKQSNDLSLLDHKIEILENNQDAIVKGITSVGVKPKLIPANFEGSGFALNNKGYIITSWHMVNGADSIFIKNDNTTRSLTRIVFSDPKIDIAVLKIENIEISKNWQVPFSFNNRSSDIGEKVFTLGYPRKDMVYGEGSLSSLTGFRSDTTMYQISIPVNPGNSGGPLLDEQGNIVGLVRGKVTNAEGTAFAIKSKEILNTLNGIAIDSTKDELKTVSKKNALKGLKRAEQIKRINPYVFNIMVYKAN